MSGPNTTAVLPSDRPPQPLLPTAESSMAPGSVDGTTASTLTLAQTQAAVAAAATASADRSDIYERIDFLGEGQFATVYKARNKETGTIVAIKKVNLGKREDVENGLNRTALREIKLLQELKHVNIIGLLESFVHKTNIHLVFEFMDADLEKIIKDNRNAFQPGDYKAYMLMTLQGLEYLHDRWILHRDLKPNNLLVASDGTLKIADFGLARDFGSPDKVYTNQVVTIWYRAPELLYGAQKYGTGIDIWATGCIFAELLLRKPLFPGRSEMDQLRLICMLLGNPTEKTWPGLETLPLFSSSPDVKPTPLRQLFSAASNECVDLLGQMLVQYPADRCTASEALQHAYFSRDPPPTPPNELPRSFQTKAELSAATKRPFLDVDGAETGREKFRRLEF